MRNETYIIRLLRQRLQLFIRDRRRTPRLGSLEPRSNNDGLDSPRLDEAFLCRGSGENGQGPRDDSGAERRESERACDDCSVHGCGDSDDGDVDGTSRMIESMNTCTGA